MATGGGAAENGAHQNIARVSMTLDALAGSGNEGMRLTDVARATGLSKTAAHRCLAGLVAYGMAAFDGDSGRFFLGDRMLAWVGAAGGRFELVDRIIPHIRRVADDVGDTVYFSVRRGDDAICYGRAEGAFPIRTLTLKVGDSRPLGVGGGSLAILAFLDDSEVERIVREHAGARAAYPLTDDVLTAKIAEARRAGYTTMEGHLVQGIRGMSSVGAPVRDGEGVVRASLSVAAISERLVPPRGHEIATRLLAEADAIRSELPELLARL